MLMYMMWYMVVSDMDTFINNRGKNNIDFDYILDRLNVYTPYGRKRKKKLKPFVLGEEKKLKKELSLVKEFIELMYNERYLFIKLRDIFVHIKDLENSIKRALDNNVLSEVELFEVKNFIFLLKDIINEVKKIDYTFPKDIMVKRIKGLESLLDPKGDNVKTFYIYDEYSEVLRDIRKEKKKVQRAIKLERKRLKDKVEKDLNIKVKGNGNIVVLKNDDRLLKKLNDHPNLKYNSETYMNIKYSIRTTDKIDDLEIRLERLKEYEESEEYDIRKSLSKKIADLSEDIFYNMDMVGKLDLTIAKANMAIETNGVMPNITDKNIIEFQNAKHIKVEDNLHKNRKSFVPISVKLKKGVTCITGANMGGKTVSLKLIGLMCTMAQYGLFVPCEKMTFGLRSFVYVSIGDLQSTDMGLSTFGGEIENIQQAIERTENRGLILIDELARGTNPIEGYAISKAIINHLKKKDSITVITTHYDNIAKDKDVIHLQVIGLSDIDFDKLKEELRENDYGIEAVAKYMDYRLIEVKSTKEVPKDAINIARLMGLDPEIVRAAEEALN